MEHQDISCLLMQLRILMFLICTHMVESAIHDEFVTQDIFLADWVIMPHTRVNSLDWLPFVLLGTLIIQIMLVCKNISVIDVGQMHLIAIVLVVFK